MSTWYKCDRALGYLKVSPLGYVHACCEGWADGQLGHLLSSDLIELHRGPKASAFRDSVESGSFNKCSRCPYLPAPHGPVSKVPSRPTMPDQIAYLALGNYLACNLSCPSCRRSPHVPTRESRELCRSVYERVLSSGWLAHVDVLRVSASGDPFASPDCLQFLNQVPWEKYPQLRLCLATNGLLLDRWRSLGSAADRVTELDVSVDAATDNTYVLNRGGNSRANNLVDNLQKVSTQTSARKTLNFVVQSNNWREVQSFVGFAHSIGFGVRFQKLYNWGTFNDLEYSRRAVHLPSHPEHDQFLEHLANARDYATSRGIRFEEDNFEEAR